MSGLFPPRNQVLQSGDVTLNHLATWVTDGVINDSGVTIPQILAAAEINTYFFDATPGTDIGTSLNSFMVDVNVAGGGTVLLPVGSFETSVQIVVPTNVKLKGAGKRSTTITATSSFPAATAVIRLGRTIDIPTFDCTLEDIQIDCNYITDSIGIYSAQANEGCGCFSVISKNFKDIGILYEDSAHNFRNEDLEVYSTNSPANYGIKVVGSGAPSGMLSISFDRVTTFGNGIGNCLAGFYLENVQVILIFIHMEGSTDGILVVGDNVAGAVIGANGVSSVTNIVHFDGGTSELLVLGSWQGFATNIIQDDLTNTTIADVAYLPIWTRSAPFVDSPPTTVTTSPYVVLSTDTSIICNRGAGVGLSLPTPSNNTGRLLYIKTILGSVVSIGTDVVPIEGGAATGDILPATPGSWALLKCDGTNWNIIEQSALVRAMQSVSSANYTLDRYDTALSANGSGLTLTLPAASAFPGRQIWIRTVVNFAVTSASSNIGTLTGGVSSTIVAGTAGKWAMLQSDGGSFWQIMASN